MRADRFEPVPDDIRDLWDRFGRWEDRTYFPSLVGLRVEEVRYDYCRMRLPYRPELDQPHGLVHGGALATLIDSVVVPAIGSRLEPDVGYATVSMDINYLGAVRGADTVAEGWVTRRGRSMTFCRAEATSEGRLVAEASLVYAMRH